MCYGFLYGEHSEPPTNQQSFLVEGSPSCHGQSQRWWTRKQELSASFPSSCCCQLEIVVAKISAYVYWLANNGTCNVPTSSLVYHDTSVQYRVIATANPCNETITQPLLLSLLFSCHYHWKSKQKHTKKKVNNKNKNKQTNKQTTNTPNKNKNTNKNIIILVIIILQSYLEHLQGCTA